LGGGLAATVVAGGVGLAALAAVPAAAAAALAPAALRSAHATARGLKSTPGQPSGVVAGPGAVMLSWTPPKRRTTGYKVRMATSSDGPWAAVTGCADVVTATACVATGLANDTPYYFQVQAVRGKRAGKLSAASDPVTLTCASGSSCVVGDTGPGGGTVFFAAATPFDAAGDTYLELADAGDWVDWTDGQSLASRGLVDPGLQWCGSYSPANDTALGSGAANTARLAQCAGEEAAHAAQAYRGGGKADWFLPSADEANLECQFAAGVASPDVGTACAGGTSLRAGFAPDLYWTSSSMNLDGLLADLAAEGATLVPCLTGQPALTASICASILSNMAPALAQNFGPMLNIATNSAATACGGQVAPVFIVPAALGLPGTEPHDGSGRYHCLREVTRPTASPQVRPVRAFH
jgi:fibronectin type III domain protein